MLKRSAAPPAAQRYVQPSIGEPLVHVLKDIAILHVREFFPHPPSSFGARSNPHPLVPPGYISLVSLKSVRGEGTYVIPCGVAVGEMQGDSRNGRTFGLDLDSAVVCPTLMPWK